MEKLDATVNASSRIMERNDIGNNREGLNDVPSNFSIEIETAVAVILPKKKIISSQSNESRHFQRGEEKKSLKKGEKQFNV